MEYKVLREEKWVLTPVAKKGISLEEFTSRHDTIYAGIGLSSFQFALEDDLLPEEEEDKALFPLEVILTSSLVGDMVLPLELPLLEGEEDFQVQWSPALLFPGMEEGDVVRVYRDFPARQR